MEALAIRHDEGLNLDAVAFNSPVIELGLVPSWTVDEHGRYFNNPEHLREFSSVRG
jgi:hypothetical protein